MLGYVLPMFFFFKQETAYEMRISDWSSDVCSSDLRQLHHTRVDQQIVCAEIVHHRQQQEAGDPGEIGLVFEPVQVGRHFRRRHQILGRAVEARSAERRVGKECVSTSSAGWSAYHERTNPARSQSQTKHKQKK